MLMATLLAALLLIIGFLTEDNDAFIFYGVGAAGIAMFAYGYNRSLTKESDESSYRDRIAANAEEHEIVIDDYFKLNTNGIGDDYWTASVNYIIYQNTFFQIHPYETKKFETENPGIGAKLAVKVFFQNKQFKIIEFSVIDKKPIMQTENDQNVSRITEKHLNDYPKYLGWMYEPRDTMEEFRTWQLAFDGKDIKNLWDNKTFKCFVKIGDQLERVSTEDFLNYKIGDPAKFINRSGEVTITRI